MEPVDDHRNDGAYANSSLPRDNLSIRLLHILPTLETNGLIRCNFIPTRLDAAIPYEALSYCWGDPKKVAQISVNGEPFHVGKNLFSALGVLCHPDTTRTIWIDAICINQNDRKEKGHQVEMMREIYSRSIRAIVWLGPGDFFTHEAMFFLYNASDKHYKEKAKEMKRPHKLLRFWIGLREAESRPIYWIESSYENNYSSVLKLLRRPWFRRIWIVQEVAFAPEAIVLCGEDSMDWDSFVKAAMILASRTTPYGLAYEAGSAAPTFHLKILSKTRPAIKEGKYFGLRETLRRFQPFESTQPVDKAFAIRALLERPEQISVDYDSPVDRVYRDVAAAIIEETQDLSILLDCHYTVAGTKSPTLPSWVPDWSASGQHRPRALTAVFAQDFYSASLDTAADISFGPDKCYMQLSGLKIDEISRIGPIAPKITELGERYLPKGYLFPKEDLYGFIVDCCDTVREWKQLGYGESVINQSSRYVTGESHYTVFWKTWLRPEPMSPSIEAERKLKLRISTLEWQALWLDWFVRKVSKKCHWLFIWSLFMPYLFWFSITAVIKNKLGQLSFETLGLPQPTQSEEVFGRTKNGLLAFLPEESHVGDLVVIFKGASRPFIIRAKENHWQLIGAAYVHGIMHGEVYDPMKLESFCLV